MLSWQLQAQSLRQWTMLGDEAMQKGDVLSAAECYSKAYALDSTNFDMTIKYAESLRLSRRYAKAEYLYEKAYNKDKGKLFPLGQFRLAQMQKMNGNYGEALRNFKKFSKKYKRDKEGYLYLKSLQEIESCSFAINARRLDGPITVQPLPGDVNTEGSEFAPFIFDSTLFYNAENDQHLISVQRAFMNDSLFYTDASYAPSWQRGVNTGNLSFSPDGTRAYYVECPDSTCHILEADVIDGRVQVGHSIKTLNGEGYSSTMPFVGTYRDQEVIFFSSDRPGTRGKLDIWWSFRNADGSWQAPANAGDHINSPDHEIAPWYSGSHLYFSSDWHVGFGGFDIFIAEGYPRSFQFPENAGYPINSSQNDLYYRYFPELQGAIMASNRSGSLGEEAWCCNDLYLVEYRDSMPSEEPEVFVSLRQLNEYLPVTLYFHNDEPNPNSRDTTTKLSYESCFQSYQELRPSYLRENTRGLSGDEEEEAEYDVEDFYRFYLEKGFNDLEMFADLLFIELEKGFSISLTVKGFASPRAQSDYNVNLTRRRIASFINYMRSAKEGAFIPYIEGQAANHATLSFVEVPFGEYEADRSVSDDLVDEQRSIFSRGARLERKIEIQSVQRGIPDSLFASADFDRLVHDFGKIQQRAPLETLFTLTNTGTDTLSIDSLASSCGCTVPTLLKTVLLPGESTSIAVVFEPAQQHGIVSRKIFLYTSAREEAYELTITAEIEGE